MTILSRRQILAAPAAALSGARGVNPLDLGAYGDGRANDLAAIRRAVEVAADRKLPVQITRPHYVDLETAADSIQLKSGSILNFEGGSVLYNYVGSPVFWAADAQNITISHCVMRFGGRMPLVAPSQLSEFLAHQVKRKAGMPPRDAMASFAFFGVENLRFVNPRFEAARFESDTLISRCIVIGDHNGRSSKNVLIEDFQADGFYMGILGWGIEGLTVRGMRCRRWGQLDTIRYAWEAPAHPIYITPMIASRDIVCTDLVDEGQEVSPWYGAGSTSFKFTGVSEGLRLARLYSRRSAGLLDFHGRDFLITDLDWAGDVPSAMSVNKVIRALSYTNGPGEFTSGVMRNVRLVLPREMNDYPISLGGIDGANIDGCVFENWLLNLPGARQSSSTPLIVTSASRSSWRNVQIIAPEARREIVAMRIDNGGQGNDIEIKTRTPVQVRVGADQSNHVRLSRI